MKKFFYATALFLGIGIAVHANPGDTTWVQANHVNLDYYNNFDTMVNFPDGSKTYRKIYLVFTLGKYDCAPGTTYCHQWDYTVLNYIMTPAGDTMEMCRFITPFATSGWSRFSGTWKQPYVFDVTDFYPLLKNNATVRILYSGYSGGFTADVKFAFIEGTPDRDVTGISKLYDGSYRYGDASDPINDHFPTISETAPAGTESATLKFLVTGHGSDPNGCCEFASHYYDVNVNSTSIAHKDIWRNDCGLNDLYPQGGTWVFDRGNWCPGAMVRPIYHNIPNITAGTGYNINVRFEQYAVDSNYGSYTTNAIVFYHAGFNKTLDASLDGIIAPTNDPNHYRANPSGDIPKVIVHNSGSSPISSIKFKYGVQDSAEQEYTWNGTIAPLSDTTINLEAVPALTNMSINNVSGTHIFNVSITAVNGQVDDDPTNDKLRSNFVVAPTWPGDLAISLQTSNIIQANGSFYLGNPHQKWIITDMEGNVVAARNNTDASTLYKDTVALPAAGFYKITVSTDNGLGLHWWFFDGNQNVVPGFFSVKSMSGANIPMQNYSYSGQAHDDFGSEYSQYFTVASPGTSGISTTTNNYRLDIYPNPAKDYIKVNVIGEMDHVARLQLINILGQVVYQINTNNKDITIPTTNLANGVYTLSFRTGNSSKMEKVVINK